MKPTPARLRRVMNLWPPFLFSGIRVQEVSADWRYARVRLKLAWYNRNYVKTHFGGSLFSMTDPFWMILIMECLGRDYIVWDQAGSIEFVAPGREDVYAEFSVEESMLDELRAATAKGERYLRWFDVDVKTAGGEVIARVRKQLYVRRKRERVAAATDPA
jgi:acyl-coenzyme A thioesterase PaaI-like protein